SILIWLLRIFKLLRCTHPATALKESSAMQPTIARAAGLTEYCCNIPITSLASAPAVLSVIARFLTQGITNLQHTMSSTRSANSGVWINETYQLYSSLF